MYAGKRRGWEAEGGSCPTEEIKLVKHWLDVLGSVDHGFPMDVLFVNNIADDIKGDHDYKEYVSFINGINGNKTKNGSIIVEHRQNIGISFGAYSDAYKKYKNLYEYFWFTEDDYINISENCLLNGIDILKNKKINNLPVGFVCTRRRVRVVRGCTGSCGITSTEVLNKCYPEGGKLSDFVYNKKKISATQGEVKEHLPYEHKLPRHIHNNNYRIWQLEKEYGLVLDWRVKLLGYSNKTTTGTAKEYLGEGIFRVY